jgi:hypothetical protein
MTDPNRDRERNVRSINTMTWIAFVLAALVGIVSILYGRPF